MQNEIITSTQNSIVKETVKLHQKKYRDKFILLEGKKTIEEAVSCGLKIEYVFSKTPFLNFKTYIVNDAILKKISTTESPPNIAAVVEKPKYNPEMFKNFKHIILLDGIKDAGNLGTIIRAACAFGIEGIFLYGNTTDEFSTKTIRSTAGNIFKIPIMKIEKQALADFKKTHKFLSAVVNNKNYLDSYRAPEKYILMFGSEADGLCKELLNITDEMITIKMANSVESLNLALSVGIFLWELQK